MNWNGLLIGIGTFLLIGCFHVVVIKSEFHFGKKVWPVFVVVGCLILAGSVFLTHPIANALTADAGHLLPVDREGAVRAGGAGGKGLVPQQPQAVERGRGEVTQNSNFWAFTAVFPAVSPVPPKKILI